MMLHDVKLITLKSPLAFANPTVFKAFLKLCWLPAAIPFQENIYIISKPKATIPTKLKKTLAKQFHPQVLIFIKQQNWTKIHFKVTQ